MQHPEHLIGTTRAGMTPRRVVGLGFVGLIHVAVIYALIMGLTGQTITFPHGPLTLTPVKDPILPKTPPNKPVLVTPQETTTIKPVIDIDPGQSTNTITTTASHDGGTGPAIPDTLARGVAGTHTIPDYPELARRLGQEGTVEMRLSIAADGAVVDASVVHSSGSDMLDQAAIAWVKAHWRYQPATHLGTPVAATTEAAIRFDLRNSR